MSELLRRVPWLTIFAGCALLYAIDPRIDQRMFALTGQPIGERMTPLFCYAILALGLNVIVGNAGMLHLGIGAFFGFGAYVTGILNIEQLPFRQTFYVCLLASFAGSALLAVLLSSPVLRLRGDYFALVTLGFGEVLRFTLRNLEEVTAGTKGLKPVEKPDLIPDLGMIGLDWHLAVNWADYRSSYLLTLAILVGVLLLLRNLERSSVGRAWVAMREDELAAASMGLNVARLKLGAIALGAGLAGLAGSLYAYALGNTSDPDQYGFNTAILVLCCLILGGVGNRVGVILGVVLVVGFDSILSPIADARMQRMTLEAADPSGEVRFLGLAIGNSGSPYLNFSGWRLLVFGLALILVMRFRPAGLLPARRGRG